MAGQTVTTKLLGKYPEFLANAVKLTLKSTGVPHMVLPMWVDLYEFATRAEFLGIGVWGNKRSAPNWTAEELTNSFLRVLDDGEEAVAIREKAYELGKIAQKEPGRLRAGKEIAKLAHKKQN
jgi:UDP:flavonoid glycosyltransferase YjiC (YdhE family)